MRQSPNSNQDQQVSVQELHGMACLLVKRHGRGASDVARFLAGEHAHYGDKRRMETWRAVAVVAFDMEHGRLGDKIPPIH